MASKNEIKITGYYGCPCHSFKDYDDCWKAHRQKFNIGDKVKNRCRKSMKGEVIKIWEEKGFYTVKYGLLRRDEHLEHAAELIKITKQTSNGKGITITKGNS